MTAGPSSAQWHSAAHVLREHAVKLDRLGDMAKEAEDAGRNDSERLEQVRAAITELDAAYARRDHGGVAQGRAIDAIREALS